MSRSRWERRSGYWLGERVDEVFMDAISGDFPGPSVVKNAVTALAEADAVTGPPA